MYQSKVSNFSHSKFPSFGISQISHNVPSMLNASTAPGFTNTQCPSHPQYVITNICRAQCCIQPLCPQCIPNHIQLHQQTKQPSKIETIVSARVNCIQKLAEQKYYLQSDLQKINQEYTSDPQTIIAELKTKLTSSKLKLVKLIDKIYDQMNQQVEIIYSAYCSQSDKALLEVRKTATPLVQHLDFVASQKQQLESDDFISTLIEVLTQFPRKPEVKQLKKPTVFGSVEVNNKILEEIHRVIDKYTHVVVNCKPEMISNNVNRITSINRSNNTKFSRISAQKSRVSERSRSKERSTIFDSKVIVPNNNVNNVIESYYNQPNEYRVFYEPLRSAQVQITQPDYFQNQGMLAYFQQNSRTLHTVNITHIEQGFSRRQLHINFLLPTQHRSIITPQNQVMLFGGRLNEIATNKCFILNGDSLFEIAQMNSDRYNFGICYNEGSIYVAGGSQTEGILTNKFERYNIAKRCWTVLKPCLDFNQGCQLDSFNHFIVKIGGKTSSSIINSIQLYNTQTDNWTSISLDPSFYLPLDSGLVQISSNELLVFGGKIKQSKSSEVFVIKFNGMQVSIQKSVQIYSDSTFTNPSYVSKKGVLALQNTTKGIGKNILRFSGTNWKFVSC